MCDSFFNCTCSNVNVKKLYCSILWSAISLELMSRAFQFLHKGSALEKAENLHPLFQWVFLWHGCKLNRLQDSFISSVSWINGRIFCIHMNICLVGLVHSWVVENQIWWFVDLPNILRKLLDYLDLLNTVLTERPWLFAQVQICYSCLLLGNISLKYSYFVYNLNYKHIFFKSFGLSRWKADLRLRFQ